jgi:osmotically-inducible protein OsmY
MGPLSKGRRSPVRAMVAIGFGGLICWSTHLLGGDADPTAAVTLDPIIVTEQKSANAIADEKLRQIVKTALHDDPYCYDYHFTVTVKDGVVILNGFAVDMWDMQDAKRISGKIPGVKRVINSIELVGQGSDG